MTYSQTGESELSITKLPRLLSTTKVVFLSKRKTTLVVDNKAAVLLSFEKENYFVVDDFIFHHL